MGKQLSHTGTICPDSDTGEVSCGWHMCGVQFVKNLRCYRNVLRRERERRLLITLAVAIPANTKTNSNAIGFL